MSDDLCSAIHQSVTTFVDSPRGRALAARGSRGELQPGEFFAAACATANPLVLDHLAQSFDVLPDNLERAFLQAWTLAEHSQRRLELDWRLDEESIKPGVDIRYQLVLQPDCISFVVDAFTETPATV